MDTMKACDAIINICKGGCSTVCPKIPVFAALEMSACWIPNRLEYGTMGIINCTECDAGRHTWPDVCVKGCAVDVVKLAPY